MQSKHQKLLDACNNKLPISVIDDNIGEPIETVFYHDSVWYIDHYQLMGDGFDRCSKMVEWADLDTFIHIIRFITNTPYFYEIRDSYFPC